jgi:formimidoylglutamate deiminase
MKQKLWCNEALLSSGWANAVTIEIDEHGDIVSIQAGSEAADAEQLSCVIPGIPNLHSHAHQRAMAGLGEKAGPGDDSFWTWRKVMYHYLERIGPDDLYHIASLLYLEMLKAGFTNVGEFQYLHHDLNGQAYQNRAEMTLQCQQASIDTGIGFTALPVLYYHGGFGGQQPLAGQKRFLNDAANFADIVQLIDATQAGNRNLSLGIAPHSLRAVTESLLNDVLESVRHKIAVVHVHIAEQTREVDDCIEWSGQRPVQWLFNHFNVDKHWCLIHATHMTDEETRQLANSGAIAGICPTTEANLGDGFFNAVDYLEQNGCWGIGSDSHISISPVEELRWFEYGQRLLTRRRNVLCNDASPNTGRALVDGALHGGAGACGRKIGKLEVGYRADFLSLDASHPRLVGRAGDSLLDSWIFSGNSDAVQHVYVGGERVISHGRHKHEAKITANFDATLKRLSN